MHLPRRVDLRDGDDLGRIERALARAGAILRDFSADRVGVRYKGAQSPVTDADMAVDDALRAALPRDDEGWLSEESPDDHARLRHRRVWIVDPLDGTREFLEGVPEWCVAIGLVQDGVAVAGGVFNPTREERFLASRETGATLNGRPISVSRRATLDGAVVLMNRWALRRAATQPLPRGIALRRIGPLCYALASIAAGRADATWGRSPKAEWDVAAGAALITAAGGRVLTWDGRPVTFNTPTARIPGLIATTATLARALARILPHRLGPPITPRV